MAVPSVNSTLKRANPCAQGSHVCTDNKIINNHAFFSSKNTIHMDNINAKHTI